MNKLDILNILFSSKVIVFAGEYGRCKSLSMVAYNFLSFALNNVNLFLTNMPFKFIPDVCSFNPLYETKQLSLDTEKINICIDEMQKDLNRREFYSHAVSIVSNFSVDLRKDSSQLIGTIQFLNRLELSMHEILQIVVIPTFINKYHTLESKDNEMRLQNKDFKVKWEIFDKKNEKVYYFYINLYDYLCMYNTNFKPHKLIVNHDEYLKKQKNKLSVKRYSELIDSNKAEIEISLLNWNKCFKEL